MRRESLFGGRGGVDVADLLGAVAAPPFTAVLYCVLDPGGSVGRHRQEEHPEIVVGLGGEGEATVDGVARPLTPGVVVHLPVGSLLSLVNRSPEEPLAYLIVKARAP